MIELLYGMRLYAFLYTWLSLVSFAGSSAEAGDGGKYLLERKDRH